MAATNQVPTIVEKLGNIPSARVTFYTDNKKPELSLASGQRASFQYYKTDKKTNTLRSSMAVILNRVPLAQVRDLERGTEFLQVLIDEVQDNALKACGDGLCEFATVEDSAKLVADYLDNSRAGGARVSSEQIGKFFDEAMTEFLVGRIVAKFPQFDTDKVSKVVQQYRQSFMDLTKYSLPQSKQVSEMMAKAWNEFQADLPEDVNMDLAIWIGERLKKLQDRHNAQEMLVDAI